MQIKKNTTKKSEKKSFKRKAEAKANLSNYVHETSFARSQMALRPLRNKAFQQFLHSAEKSQINVCPEKNRFIKVNKKLRKKKDTSQKTKEINEP